MYRDKSSCLGWTELVKLQRKIREWGKGLREKGRQSVSGDKQFEERKRDQPDDSRLRFPAVCPPITTATWNARIYTAHRTRKTHRHTAGILTHSYTRKSYPSPSPSLRIRIILPINASYLQSYLWAAICYWQRDTEVYLQSPGARKRETGYNVAKCQCYGGYKWENKGGQGSRVRV